MKCSTYIIFFYIKGYLIDTYFISPLANSHENKTKLIVRIFGLHGKQRHSDVCKN